MIDNIFNLDNANIESFSKLGLSLINSKVGFSIAVVLITLLLLSPLSTFAFRQSFSFDTSKPRRNAKTAMREFRPSLSFVRDESLQSVKKKLDYITVKLEDRKESVKRLLDEFSQPFFDVTMSTSDNNSMVSENSEEQDEHTIIVKNPNAPKEGMAHFVFLVHGYNGRPADLLYLRTAMAGEAEKRLALNADKTVTASSNGSHTKEIVFHSCQTNSGQTSDGVEKGGERVFNEMRSVINDHINFDGIDGEHVNITVSLIGNSLGGLYSRYAIAKLSEESDVIDREFLLSGGKIKAHFNIFCTTATPHLGVAGHTYFPIPRSAEIGIGKAMGQTGRDLFRLSDLIYTMCTCPTYLDPLRSFRKRIAYANAYKTDFVVPTNTAAFLNPDSTYPHHVSDEGRDDPNTFEGLEKNDMVVARFHTPQGASVNHPSKIVSDDNNERPRWSLLSKTHNTLEKDELLEMSTRMDELGWKKVIVDVRELMPVSIRIPKLAKRKISSLPSNSTDGDNSSTESNSSEKIAASSSPSVVESRSIANVFSSASDVLPFPLGHNTLVAVEKHGLSKAVFKAGRPVMDGLAKEIVIEILAWNWDTNNSTA